MVLPYLRRLALRVAADPSAAMLLACNTLAIVFAFFNPPVSVSVMFLYWAECAIVGLLNFIKLFYIEAQTTVPVSISMDESEWERMSPGKKMAFRSIGPGIFLVPYGMFLFFLFSLLYALGEHEMQGKGVRHYDMAGHLAGFWLPVLLIGAGHVASFFRNFLGRHEYVGRGFHDQMFRPVKRAILMFVVMFGGIAAIIVTGLPEIALLFFIPFMIIAGLEAHFRERAA